MDCSTWSLAGPHLSAHNHISIITCAPPPTLPPPHPQDDSDGDIYAKYDPRLHGKKRADGIRPLKPGCLRKFVINMRKRYDGKSKVELTPAAVAAMRDFYIELRASAKDRWGQGGGGGGGLKVSESRVLRCCGCSRRLGGGPDCC